MNVQVRDVACLFFLLYANLLVLVTLCEGNHYPFIEEDKTKIGNSQRNRNKKVFIRKDEDFIVVDRGIEPLCQD